MTMTAPKMGLDGILLIDKPSGCTSHDVVDALRKKLHIRKVGHAGTLDPLATGLLIMLIGKATKASQYLMSLGKEYEATMKLGETTDSQDADGEIILTRPVPELTEEAIKEVFDGFMGDQYQLPPMFSAKKVKGQPLYKLARQGKVVEREPRVIHVGSLELLEMNLPEVTFRVACSKGTYVRTLAHDMGEKLSCGAHLTELRRTGIDKFRVNDAVKLEDLQGMQLSEIKERIVPVYEAVKQFSLKSDA